MLPLGVDVETTGCTITLVGVPLSLLLNVLLGTVVTRRGRELQATREQLRTERAKAASRGLV